MAGGLIGSGASSGGATTATTSRGRVPTYGSVGPAQAPMSAPVGGGGNLASLLGQVHPPTQVPPVTIAPPVLSNYAQANPALQAASNAAADRYSQLQRNEGRPDPYQLESIENLRKRLSADTTQHAIDRAGNAIKTQAAGMQTAQDAAMARRGLAGSGLQARGMSGLSEAAQRAQAKSATDISLGREAQLDALTLGGAGILNAPSQLGLAQQGLTNQGLGLQMQGASALANQGLAQQGLGLSQWQASNSANLAAQQLQLQQQQQQWAQLMGLLGLAQQPGYGGYSSYGGY